MVAFCSDPKPQGYPFEVTSVARGALPVRYLKAAWQVWRKARAADVVYINEHLALLHVFAAKLALRPVVIRIMVDGIWEISHRKGWIGGDTIETFETKSYGLRVRAARLLQKGWWTACSRIIACSDFLRRIPIERYGIPEHKVELIYNAYHGPTQQDFSLSQTQARQQLGLDSKRKYALTICRLMVWKGVDGIIDALAELPADVDLLVAGDGDMLASWTEHARAKGLAARVHFLGNVPYEKIPLFVRAADVFVLNSEYEGLSHTLLEVSALGTPIVATNVCGNPEVVAHETNGLLVPMRNPSELAKAMQRILSDPELGRRFAQAGLARMQRFSRETTFGRVEQVLREVSQ